MCLLVTLKEVQVFKNILLPTDGSALADEAVYKGIIIAKNLGAKVIGLHVIPRPVPGDIWDVWTPDDSEDANRFRTKFREKIESVSHQYLAAIEKKAAEAGVACETVSVYADSVYEAILNVAGEKGCDLIVMNSHGNMGVKSTLLGSVTTRVLGHSKIPVLVCR